ncbi:MAG: leucine--tRNA ligase [Methanobacteriaceae archaeon]
MNSDTNSNIRVTEKKWQNKWNESKVFQSNPDNREKLYLTVAYPYPSGAMHIGHGRTYTVPDVYAHFKRMQGYNVLFPMAWHVTGAPVIGIAKRIERQDQWTLDLYENVHKVPKDELSKFKEPEYIVKYFSKEYHKVMSDMGYSIDWRREFRTTDPSYNKFIEWQLKKLKNKGLVRKGRHAVKYCPSCDNPVGDHDLLEGEGATINEMTLLKFKIDDNSSKDIYLVPATFRPETIYGVTNLWMNPDLEYIEVKTSTKIGNETWIIAKDAFENMSNQIERLEIIADVDIEPLISKNVVNPVTGEKHPIFPASFVDGEYGSGVVFSVPAHAPADFIALCDLQKNLELLNKYNLGEIVANINIPNVITLKGYSDLPAKDLIEKLDIKNQEDPNLAEATNELYKNEHLKGKISSHISDYAGIQVSVARDEIKDAMIANDQGAIMYDFSERPVVCRCGNRCVIKIMNDQWFLRYSDEDWKEKTRLCLERENIIPKEIRANFDYYIGWLEDWACSRRIGLGTQLPWDKQWLIEPLTDSSIYMSYYTIANHLKDIDVEDLNDAFFNKVFLNSNDFNCDNGNIGDDNADINVPMDIINNIQNEFNYWYPLDWRLSAKDLIGNHLSFHMFHHAAIFPQDKWPRGMVVFGMGLMEGHKMSSSKGNVILLSEAIEHFGADVVRLFLMSSAEPWQDFDWREKEVKGTQRRLEWLNEFAERVNHIAHSKMVMTCSKEGRDCSSCGAGDAVNKNGANHGLDIGSIVPLKLSRNIDLWMISQLNLRIKEATKSLESFQTRKAAQNALFLLKKDVDHYIYRIRHLLEENEDGYLDKVDFEIIYVLSTVLESWIRLMAPFTPHLAEELWNKYGGDGFVIESKWPVCDDSLIDVVAQKSEELVQNIVKDINQIKIIVDKDVDKVHIYLAPDWKWEVFKIAHEVGKPDIGQIIGRSMKANIAEYDVDKKSIASFAKRAGKEITKSHYIGKIDEFKCISSAEEYISEEVGAELVIHTDNSYDPENKYQNSSPYKPALYME